MIGKSRNERISGLVVRKMKSGGQCPDICKCGALSEDKCGEGIRLMTVLVVGLCLP